MSETVVNGKAIIVGGGGIAPGDLDFYQGPDDLVLAADSGYEALKKAGRIPDLLVGDLDSLEEAPKDIPLIRLPVEKDDTDTAYCVKEALDRGYRKILIFGALGGDRISHTVANLQLLKFIRDQGAVAMLKQGKTRIQMLVNEESIYFPPGRKAEISLFAYGQDTTVTLRGLKYSGDYITLSPGYPLGVSNSLTGEEAVVEVHEGTLLVIQEE